MLIAAACNWRCIGDAYQPVKPLPGGYQLTLSDDSRYYVGRRFGVQSYTGVMGGPIERLGWSDEYIVGLRGVPEIGASGSGWMIITLKSGEIRGPLTPTDFERLRTEDKDLGAITLRPIEEVWRGLWLRLTWPPSSSRYPDTPPAR